MSQKIKNPNEKGSGFVVGIIALIAIVAVVIGVVLYMGRNQPVEGMPDEDVSFSVSVEGDAIRLASDSAAPDAVVAEVYEDFSCHFCAEMSQGGHDDELKALDEGSLVVEYRPLNFLDRGNPDGHSTRALAVAHRVAETGDARLFWNFHTLLMSDLQEAYTWSDDDFADRLKDLGAPSDLVSDVREGLGSESAVKIGKANGERLEGIIGSVSSPHVIVDGKDVLDGIQQGGLGEWVSAALEAGKK